MASQKKKAPPATIGAAIGGAIDTAVGSVAEVGSYVESALGLVGLRKQRTAPGAIPGIDHLPEVETLPEAGTIRVTCIDYNAERIETTKVDDIEAFLQKPRPDWCHVRWINVDGLHPHIVHVFQQTFGYHTLAAEDVLHVPQRPKVEAYDNDLFIVLRMLRFEEARLQAEQVSMFLRHGLLVTFQEQRPGDVWDPIRRRLDVAQSRIRAADASYLAYALLDAVVDHCFPILERYGDVLEALELKLLGTPKNTMLRELHAIKRDLLALRRVMWPTREVVNALLKDETDRVSRFTHTFLRDVYEHTIQVVDIIETFRDMAGGLTELYMSAVSNRMNEIMKVLTIIATIFIPITFLAGVYGMNFDHLPELHWKWSYPLFWVICISATCALLYFFKRRGWLGKGY